jgi:ABC-2 type transport system ATP-binding protein
MRWTEAVTHDSIQEKLPDDRNQQSNQKIRRNHLAVDRLTLQIEAGEVFGFLGPNGAGKTTTVRMLASLITPTSGSAKVLGYAVSADDQEIRRNVGILTETPGMYERLSARKNLLIYANLYEVAEPEKQVEKYLQMLGLWERRDDRYRDV